VFEAAFWGFVGGAALLVGALAGIFLPVSVRFIGLIMGFGVGVLFSAVAFELTDEAYSRAGTDAVVYGLVAGALAFFVGDWLIDNHGGHRRKSPVGMQEGAGPTALVLGALLDGIPESAAIGISLVEGGSVGVALLLAVFLSNIPESLSASAGMKASGSSTRHIMGIWLAVTVASTVAAAVGVRRPRRCRPGRARHHPGLRGGRDPDHALGHDGPGGGPARGSPGRPGHRARLRLCVPALRRGLRPPRSL
jgi:ZIP family zinc transporter